MGFLKKRKIPVTFNKKKIKQENRGKISSYSEPAPFDDSLFLAAE